MEHLSRISATVMPQVVRVVLVCSMWRYREQQFCGKISKVENFSINMGYLSNLN
jgi:hypothetical protein